jgi:hypothetical protein
MMQSFSRRLTALVLAVAIVPVMAGATEKTGSKSSKTYNQKETLAEAEAFFGEGAKGIADVVAKAFKDQGEPSAFIKGEEAGGAIGVGLRYGKGTLVTKSGANMPLYWQGPSIGFDIGGNAAKTFVLIYNLNDTEKLFQRYPGVEGSLYFVGGVGMNYARSGDVTVAPMRFGVGWRQGASVGYMHFTKEKRINPF